VRQAGILHIQPGARRNHEQDAFAAKTRIELLKISQRPDEQPGAH